jgi:RNA polymerase sigma-70 factor (ECF subfamily)
METQTREIIQSVIERHSLMVYRLAYVRAGTRHDADDIYQEVFLRYISASPTFKCPEHEKAWFIRVTVNVSRNFLKSAWRKRAVTLTEEAGYMEDLIPGSASELREALAALPEKSRTVIHLHYFENMTAEEIAGALHLTAPAVRMILSRTRKQLKATLDGEEVCVHA